MRNAAGYVWSGWRWPQLTIADHGRLKPAWSGVGRSKMTMARHRWPWPVMALPGWPGCSALDRNWEDSTHENFKGMLHASCTALDKTYDKI